MTFPCRALGLIFKEACFSNISIERFSDSVREENGFKKYLNVSPEMFKYFFSKFKNEFLNLEVRKKRGRRKRELNFFDTNSN